MAEEKSKVSIQEEIEKLLQLQDRDMKLRELRAEKEEQPKRLAALKESFQARGKDLAQAKEALKSKQAEMKKIELEVESTKQNILKHSNQLFQVKSNEEYRALEKEIALEKSQSSDREDVIIQDMMEIDTIKEKIKQLEEKHAQDEKELKAQETLIQERIKNLEVQIKQLQDERHNLEVRVREDILSVYNRVLKNKPESPVVPVQNYICLGCHMSLIHQTYADVRRGTELVHCENCSRILYLTKD